MSRTIFYTTASMEQYLEDQYNKMLSEKDEAMEELKSKYTAKALVNVPDRVFLVGPYGVYFVFEDGFTELCPSDPVPGGRTYRLDLDCLDLNQNIKSFQEKYQEYKVTFHITGKYGPTIEYLAPESENVYPATLTAGDDQIKIEDDDKYDICCL